MIETEDVYLAIKQLRKEPKPRVVLSHDAAFNRALLDHGNFEILVFNVKSEKKDTPKQLGLNLNDIMLRIAAKKNIVLGINLTHIRNLGKRDKAHELARLRFLVALARKAKLRISVLNSSDSHTAKSFTLSLGASTQQSVQAVDF